MLQGAGGAGRRSAQGDPRGMAAQDGGEAAVAGGDAADRGDGWAGGADGPAARAVARAEGAAPGRVEVDRHRGDLTVRGIWLQSGGGADRPGRVAASQRGEGVGPA